MDYISYLEIANSLGLKKGDTILLSSDITRLVYQALKHKERFDVNLFIDSFIEAIGQEGTLLIPTYNWDFCHAITFDYSKTPCMTGVLGESALMRSDFRRTKHPIYSFAVKGKYQDLLCNMTNKSSFGADSPFSFLEMMKGKNVIIDKELTHCFTFVHYVEERAGVNTYRYLKDFQANYIDENGIETTRAYSMLVWHLQNYYGTDLKPLEEGFLEEAISQKFVLNKVPFTVVDLFKAAIYTINDVRNNQSRKICKHKWQ